MGAQPREDIADVCVFQNNVLLRTEQVKGGHCFQIIMLVFHHLIGIDGYLPLYGEVGFDFGPGIGMMIGINGEEREPVVTNELVNVGRTAKEVEHFHARTTFGVEEYEQKIPSAEVAQTLPTTVTHLQPDVTGRLPHAVFADETVEMFPATAFEGRTVVVQVVLQDMQEQFFISPG